MQLVAEFVLRFLEFFDRLSHATRQLGQFLRAEENQHDQQQKDQFLSADVHEREKFHICDRR